QGKGAAYLAQVSWHVKPSRAAGTSPLRPLDGRACLPVQSAGAAAVQPVHLALVVGARPFPAHRAILGARCEYLARLFSGGAAAVVLSNADPVAFEPLLSYMHGGGLCRHRRCSASCDGGPDVYFSSATRVWKLDGDNVVHLVAGSASAPAAAAQAAPVDGPGSTATFQRIHAMALGSAGALYLLDGGRLRVVRLPLAGSASAAALAVETVDLQVETGLGGLAYDRSTAALYLGTQTQLFKVQSTNLRALTSVTHAHDIDNLESLAVTSAGVLLVVTDDLRYQQGLFLTATIRYHQKVFNRKATVLPQGGVVLHGKYGPTLLTLLYWDKAITPSRAPGTSPLRPRPLDGRARLGAELSGLLGPQPCSPPDLTVVVGGSSFPAHRAILGARCEYFARLFSGGFSDSSSAAVVLPDADPAAYEPLLSYVYGGELRPAPQLLRPMAELAARLLLPEASSHLQQQILASTRPATVVGDMLWADQHALGELLAGLKAFYLRYEQHVVEQAPDSIAQLIASNPKLHVELYVAMTKRARLRGGSGGGAQKAIGGPQARFARIAGVAVAENGDLLVTEIGEQVSEFFGDWGSNVVLRTLAMPGCSEVSPVTWHDSGRGNISFLPRGGVVSASPDGLLLWPGSVKPSRAPGPSPLRPLHGRARLGADLSGLLGPQPCSPPDLVVVVGGSSFPAHRAILSARCEYFSRLFSGGFSDSSNSAFVLPDADPAAFEPLLSYVYGGELRTTPQLLRPVAALADRLLLPEASSHLQQQVLATTRPATVVGDMLWAEQRGLSELLVALKRSYVSMVELVADRAPESIEQLVACSPKLHRELHAEVVRHRHST
ncbi:Kelch-like protein 30, partial [Tetrabaena socialis]